MRKNHQTGSVMNFATIKDQVCRCISNWNNVARFCSSLDLSSTSLMMYARSASLSFWIFSGTLYIGSQKNSHTRPAMPAKMKAHCQPREYAINGTIAGAMIAPAFVPAARMKTWKYSESDVRSAF